MRKAIIMLLFCSIIEAGYKTVVISTSPYRTKTYIDELSTEQEHLVISTTTIMKKLAINTTYYDEGLLPGILLRGTLYYDDDTAQPGRVLTCGLSRGKAYWSDLSSVAGDNLGNHIATTTLNMNNNSITNVNNIYLNGTTIRGLRDLFQFHDGSIKTFFLQENIVYKQY